MSGFDQSFLYPANKKRVLSPAREKRKTVILSKVPAMKRYGSFSDCGMALFLFFPISSFYDMAFFSFRSSFFLFAIWFFFYMALLRYGIFSFWSSFFNMALFLFVPIFLFVSLFFWLLFSFCGMSLLLFAIWLFFSL